MNVKLFIQLVLYSFSKNLGDLKLSIMASVVYHVYSVLARPTIYVYTRITHSMC